MTEDRIPKIQPSRDPAKTLLLALILATVGIPTPLALVVLATTDNIIGPVIIHIPWFGSG